MFVILICHVTSNKCEINVPLKQRKTLKHENVLTKNKGYFKYFPYIILLQCSGAVKHNTYSTTTYYILLSIEIALF